ncbi:phosphate propanoyltransferase [Halobacillus mangrovi]|uniref:Phosphate propanoyltransferase n=1 Tax=Halobacillus mangrovi TaxID=402384 RepID=A0A1W5ZSR3_9BACI|nr:phosphate propanoyltransferase [Halobacillus mangrovi]ARI76319.1 propanediol utilization protein [Halobacillus mangrovi]
MGRDHLESIVEEVMKQMAEENTSSEVPIGVSARHCHLDKESLEVLFGSGYELSEKAPLSQPGQFAANETVTIAGPRGSITKVRILGPLRSAAQVEVSQTDAFKIGLKPPIRQSGDIEKSSPVTIIGPKGSIYLEQGLIIAQAHIHMSPQDADNFKVKDGDVVEVRVKNPQREVSFSKTIIRVSKKYQLEMHIDTDEANAGSIQTGQKGTLKKVEPSYV